MSRLKPHEEIIQDKLERVKKSIIRRGYLKNPIVVDKKTFVILDGHHRYNAFKEMGFKKIPVQMVDYFSEDIRIKSRRSNIEVSKESVIKRAKSGKPFPFKTTKHIIKGRLKGINYILPTFIPEAFGTSVGKQD
jgi:ParB-like chromosome segregation protein Spo0J